MAAEALDGDVAGALCDGGQLSVSYSPVASLADGRVTFARAGLRWRHPTRGVVAPDDVRDAVEGSSVAQLVTEFALEDALARCAAWGRGGLDVAVAVDLGPADLADAATARRVLGMVSRAGLPPASLRVAVSANAPMMSGPALAARTLSTLGTLVGAGVGVALDDVEWCAGGVAALLEIPATSVNLDAHFTDAMASDPSAARVVRAVAGMARAAGLGVTAAGVSGRAQRDALSAAGATHASGPLYGRAGDGAALARVAARRAAHAPRAIAA